MAKKDIREIIGKEFFVFDGGFGSQLQARGVPAGTNSAEINVDRADLVCAIHKDYVDAGSTCIVTNTFGADKFHITDAKVRKEQITAACNNARKTADEASLLRHGTYG